MTTTATEDTAQAEAIPLGSYRALRAWREHREAALAVPLSAEVQAAVNLCQAGMMLHAIEQHAEYMRPLAESLPKRVPGAASLPPPLPYTPFPMVTPEPEDAHEQASKADLARWTGGETLDEESPREEAVERLLDIHDTDPAGEPAGETAVITGLEDEPPA